MGIRVHPRPPPVPGPDCLACTPDPWPSGATPQIIRIVASGMTEWPGTPPQPNGVPVHAVNSIMDPCTWSATLYFGAGTYDYWYIASDSQIGIERTDPSPRPIFEGYLDPCLIGPFPNQATHPDGSQVGGNGYALDFPLSIIVALTDSYNIQPDLEALYDIIDSADPDHKTVRLTGRISSGSCLIELDPDDI